MCNILCKPNVIDGNDGLAVNLDACMPVVKVVRQQVAAEGLMNSLVSAQFCAAVQGDSHGLFTIKQIRQWLSSMARKPDLRQQFEDFKVASVWRVNRADQRMPLYQVVSADGWTMSV